MKIEKIQPVMTPDCCSAPSSILSKPAPPNLDPLKGYRQPASNVFSSEIFVKEMVDTPIGQVPRVESAFTRVDRRGALRSRIGAFRMHYAVTPGVYALGRPGQKSPVLVTANYKLSFDHLRSRLPHTDAWILVLDTKGINVWCAAGKGTFGTQELINRVLGAQLGNLVEHRKLIVPQLGAPGISAHHVEKETGFRVVFGPVEARDLPAFLDGGQKATPQMRRKEFPLRERAVLIPIELLPALRAMIPLSIILFVLSGLASTSGYLESALNFGPRAVLGVLFATIAGAVLVPLALPFLPGRAFSVKGLWAGLLFALPFVFLTGIDLGIWPGRLEAAAWFLFIPAVSAYLAMKFTGASTYTSVSGVRKEIRWALPLELGGAAFGLLMLFASYLVG